MVKIGMVINDRYEIIEKIGTGGMSDVYKALDTKLNRNVAVKVLKQEFAENESFVSKFRVEAQAAAGLMHPNIVNVYDVGEDQGIHYIVMELVEGITLKKYIEKKARLTYKEAVSIAIQVSLGIEAAHNNHIIHRDIKPQNIIISRDGKVKVTDFGIAKAATSNTITSNVMGSVHYTSPEQARGGYSDEKSDIYSLGISMFEMLTGRVPFNGETTVAIAIKHIQEPMPSPREYVPEIPECVESIIFKCTEKSPDRRYQNMAELIADLKQALLTPEVDFVDRQTAAVMGGTRTITDEEMAQIKNSRAQQTSGVSDTDRLMTLAPKVPVNTAAAATNYSGTSKIKTAAVAESVRNSQTPDNDYYEAGTADTDNYREGGYENGGDADIYDNSYDNNQYSGENPENYDQEYVNENYDDYAENGDDTREGSGLEDEEDYNPKVERVTTIVAIAAGVVIVILIVIMVIYGINHWFNAGTNNSSNESETAASHVLDEPDDTETETAEVKKVKIPQIEGADLDTIRNQLYGLGFADIEVTYENSDTVASGKVISANVNEGDEVDSSTTIKLIVSNGTGGTVLPDVSGLTYETAYNALSKAGFTVTKVEESSSTVEEGYVISQSPEAADNVPEGTQIVLTVSSGKATVRVPNLIGLTEEEATLELVEAGLKAGTTTSTNSDSVKEGLVCSQSVANGTYIEEGSTVDIVLSSGTGVKTYKYDAKIEAPTDTEMPGGYKSGTAVKVVLTTADGKEILSTTVTSFPVTSTYYGLTSSSGTITMTYTVEEETEKKDENGNIVYKTDDAGNPTTEPEMVTNEVEKSFTRSVTFEEEK